MLNVMLKVVTSIIYLLLAFCITAWIPPINRLYLWSSSELFDLMRTNQLIKGDYQWGLDPASNMMLLIFVVVIALMLSVLFRAIKKKV